MTLLPNPNSDRYGFVTCRIIRRIADSGNDTDNYPDALGMDGSVVFTPLATEVVSSPPKTLELRDPVVAPLNSAGIMVSPAQWSLLGVWLLIGQYRVTFNLLSGKIESFDIDVKETHTLVAPLDLVSERPWTPEVAENHVLLVTPQLHPGEVLARNDNGELYGVPLSQLGLNSNAYSWIRYADTIEGIGISSQSSGKKYLGIAVNKLSPVSSNNPADYSWAKITGDPGADGVSAPGIYLTATAQLFIVSADGDSNPSSITVVGSTINTSINQWFYAVDGAPFLDLPPVGVARQGNLVHVNGQTFEGQQLVVKALDEFGNAGTIAIAKLQEAIPGDPGVPGRSVDVLVELYYVSTSSEALVGGVWSPNTPNFPVDGFLWLKTEIEYSDGTVESTEPICVTGTGADGSSVLSSDMWYYQSTSNTILVNGDWTTTAPLWTEGTYVWSKVITTYDNGSQTESDVLCITPAPIIYTWIRYADTPTSGMSNDPEGKDYIGIATNKLTPVESNTYSDYKWSKMAGADGVPGDPGEDGITYYTWIRYADDSSGSGISNDPAGKAYLGLAFNKLTSIESANPEDYTWSRIRGDQGPDGLTILLTNEAHVFPATALTATAGSTTTTILAYKGSTALSVVVGTITGQVSGLTTAIANNGTSNPTITVTVTTSLNSNGKLMIPVTVDGKVFTKEFTWTLGKGGGSVSLSATSNAIAVSATGTKSPTTITVTGTGVNTTISAWQYAVDGGAFSTTVPAGCARSGNVVTITSADVTAANAISVRMADSIGNSDVLTVFKVLEGAPGQPTYTWLKYADSPTSGMSDLPFNKDYIGLAHNKTTAIESTNYGDYSWSLVKGEDGVPGDPGVDGLTTYTWIKYATSSAGAGMSDSPTNKTYIGLAYNKLTATESTDPADYAWALIQGSQGVPGDNAKSVYITSTAQVLTSPAVGGVTSPATAVVTGTALNTTIDKWEYSVDGAAFSAIVPPGASRSGNIVTITGSSMAASTIAIRMSNTASGAADTLTVGKVWHGAAGSDARLALLSNESHTFAGTTNAAVAGSTTTAISVYKGATPQTITAITFAGQPTGLTPSVTSGLNTTSPVVTFTVTTALVAQSGAVTLTITADGQTFTKVFSFAVARTGASGVGVSSIIEEYYSSTSATAPTGGSWVTTPPVWVDGNYIWTRSKITYTDATITTTSPVNPTGAKGSTGISGISVVSVDVEYYRSTSSTTQTGGSWSTTAPAWLEGTYMWSRTKVTYSSGSPTTTAPVCITGSTGATGVSVTSVTTYYRTVIAGSAAPAAPTTSTPPEPWSATEPAYAPGLDLYRVERVGYSTGAYSYTPVSKSSAYAAAVYVANLAEAATQGLVKVQADDPGHYVGRIWYQLHPTGHAQAGQLKALWRSDGTTWASYMLAANDIIAPGTVTAGVINTKSLATATAFIESLVGGEAFLQSLAVNEAVVSGANLLLEPTMRSSGAGWTGATSLRTIVSVPDGPNGAAASVMRITPTTSDQSVANYGFGPGGVTGIAVEPGAVFRCRMVLRKVSGTAGLVRLCSGQFRAGQSNQWPLATSSLNLATATTGEWITVEGTVTMRDDRDLMSMSIHLPGAAGAVVEVASVSVVRMASGSLIVDGAIGADHITASESLSAKAAQFIKVNADQLVVTGGAAFTQAFIQALTSDATFTKELYTHRAVISSGDLAPDPGIDPDAWVLEQDCVIETGHSSPASGAAFRTYCATTNSRAYTRKHPCMAGEVFSLSGSAQNMSASVGWWLGAYWYNSSGAWLPLSTAYVGMGSSGAGQVTAPAGACYMRVCVSSQTGTGSWRVYNVKASRAVDGTVITPGAISTGHMSVGSINVDRLNADTFNGKVIKGAVIRQEDSNNSMNAVELSNRTLKFTRDDDGTLVTSTLLGGTSSDRLRMLDSTGDVSVSLDAGEGTITAANTISASQYIWDGDDLADIVANLAGGVVATGKVSVAGRSVDVTSGTTESNRAWMELGEIRFDVKAGRVYTVSVMPVSIYVPAGAYAYMKASYTTNPASPARPYRTNNILANINCLRNVGGGRAMLSLGGTFSFQSSYNTSFRVLFFVEFWSPSTPATAATFDSSTNELDVTVVDVGLPEASNAVIARKATNTVAEPDPPAPVAKTYTKTYDQTWFKSWRGGSSVTTELGHGSYMGYDRYSMVGFNSSDIASDLSGATITKVEVYLTNIHWWGSSGTVHVGAATNTSAPSNPITSGTTVQTKMNVGAKGWVKVGGFTTSSRSITLGAGAGTSTSRYGKFKTSGVKLRITYTK